MSEEPAKKTHRLHVPITDAQHRALNLLSSRTGQSRAYIAREALRAYLKQQLSPDASRAKRKQT